MNTTVKCINEKRNSLVQRKFEEIVDVLDNTDFNINEAIDKMLNLSKVEKKNMLSVDQVIVWYGRILKWFKKTGFEFYAYNNDVDGAFMRYYPSTLWIRHPFNDKMIIEVREGVKDNQFAPRIKLIERKGIIKKCWIVDFRDSLENTQSYEWFKERFKLVMSTMEEMNEVKKAVGMFSEAKIFLGEGLDNG